MLYNSAFSDAASMAELEIMRASAAVHLILSQELLL